MFVCLCGLAVSSCLLACGIIQADIDLRTTNVQDRTTTCDSTYSYRFSQLFTEYLKLGYQEMTALNDLSNFSGNEGESDALKWYKSFLGAAGPLGERGMLNHFPLFMEPDSPAQMWCDDLPDGVMSNWTALDRNFRRTWLRRGDGKVEAMERFQNHRLSDDAIFSPTSVDVATMNKVIVEWADSHAKLGDEALVEATIPNLPPFLRAFLRYNSSPPTTFKSLCTKIKEITDPILEFEQLHRQERGTEWAGKVENNQDVPKVVEPDEVDTISFFLPLGSPPTEVSLNKARMAEAVKEAMGALRKYKPSEISIDAARMTDIGLLYYCNAVKVPGQFQPNTIVGTTGTKSTLWHGIFEVNYQNGPGDLSEGSRTWESFFNSTNIIRGECIYESNHTQFICIVNGNTYAIPSNSIPYCGGLAQRGDASSLPSVRINSFSTTQYFLLSVYLAERIPTSDKGYKQAAIKSADWIMKWAYNKGAHLAKDFTWHTESACEWKNTAISPHVTGLFIEGLCVLADVTSDQKWTSHAVSMCNAAMVYQNWHDANGVFKYVSTSGPSAVDDPNVFRGLLIRGLSVAYQRNPDNNELRRSIRNYINVQFNALRNNVNAGGSYPMTWNGSSSELCAHGQIAALEALMAAVIVNHY